MLKNLKKMFNLYLGKIRMGNKQTDYENNYFQWNKVKNFVIK